MNTNRDPLEPDLELQRKLRALPAPAPRAGFARRVFAAVRAVEAHTAPRRWTAFNPGFGYALAASLAVGIALPLWFGNRAPEVSTPVPAAELPVALINAVGAEVRPVRLLFRSPRALHDVTVVLDLPEGVELAGQPGLRQVSWQTDLEPGANVLELPVQVRSGTGGVLMAQLRHGGDTRRFPVRVRAATPSSRFQDRPASERAAALHPQLDETEVPTHA